MEDFVMGEGRDLVNDIYNWVVTGIEYFQNGENEEKYRSYRGIAIRSYIDSGIPQKTLESAVKMVNNKQTPASAYNEATKYIYVKGLPYSINDVVRTPDGGFKKGPNGSFILKPNSKPIIKDSENTEGQEGQEGQEVQKGAQNTEYRSPQSTVFGQVDMSQFAPMPGMSGNTWNNLTNDYEENYKYNPSITRGEKDSSENFKGRISLDADSLIESIGNDIIYNFFSGADIYNKDSFKNFECNTLWAWSKYLNNRANFRKYISLVFKTINRYLRTYAIHYIEKNIKQLSVYFSENNVSIDDNMISQKDYNRIGTENAGTSVDVLDKRMDVLKWLVKNPVILKRIMEPNYNRYYIDILNSMIETIPHIKEIMTEKGIDSLRKNVSFEEVFYDAYLKIRQEGRSVGGPISPYTFGKYTRIFLLPAIRKATEYYDETLDDQNDPYGFGQYASESRLRKRLSMIINETINKMMKGLL